MIIAIGDYNDYGCSVFRQSHFAMATSVQCHHQALLLLGSERPWLAIRRLAWHPAAGKSRASDEKRKCST